MHLISEKGCQIYKLIALFPAGRNNETKRGLAQAVAAMIKKATQKKTYKTLHQLLDNYSIQIDAYSTPMHLIVELHSHINFIQQAIPIFLEIIFEAKFSKSQWTLVRGQIVDNISQQLHQSDYWADRLLSEHLFGENHPLGYYSQPEDYHRISLQDIEAFYQKNIAQTQPVFFLAGDKLNEVKNLLSRHLSNYALQNKKSSPILAIPDSTPIELSKKLEGASQASIRIGKIMKRNSLNDFLELELWNCFLGGHYRSELMKKLRIEFGYTYGVYSSLTHYPNYSYFQIAFETDKKNVEPSIAVIKEVFLRFLNNKKIDLTEAKKQYYSQWANNAERSLQEISYRMKLEKLKYSYSQFKYWITEYEEKIFSSNSTIQRSLLDFDSYSKAIVY